VCVAVDDGAVDVEFPVVKGRFVENAEWDVIFIELST
jgi:hypothetical protein